MLEVYKRETESPASLLYRFTKKVKRSGLLKEVKRRKFYGRPVTKRRQKLSALHRGAKREEMERLKKMGLT